MKYFTAELMARLGSPDDAVANAAAAEWDQILERYEHRLQQIRAEMPQHDREYNDLLLHDADILSIARRGDQFIVVLRKDITPRDVLILTYTLTAEPLINMNSLPTDESSPV